VIRPERERAQCPYCRARNWKCVPAVASLFTRWEGLQVECQSCGARGPAGASKGEAFARWRGEARTEAAPARPKTS